MCGRFAFYSPHEATEQLFALEAGQTWPAPRWNIPPSAQIAVIRAAADGRRTLTAMRWGLVPFWAKDRDIGARLANARAETLAEKPAFRAAYRSRRALVPADGYYEWRAVGATKQPYLIQSASGEPFALAALWESWTDPVTAEVLLSCALLTRESLGALREIHHRMPVILPRSEYAAWLDPAVRDTARADALVGSTAGIEVRMHPVSRRVNSPRNDGPDLLQPEGDGPIA